MKIPQVFTLIRFFICVINEKALKNNLEGFIVYFVRMIGLEPTRLTAPDPKSGAATNYATSACVAFCLAVQR